MSANTMDSSEELPETVVTFGGGSRSYHRLGEYSDGLTPACGQTGRNPIRKERTLIESHYEPCGRCFPRAGREDNDGGD